MQEGEPAAPGGDPLGLPGATLRYWPALFPTAEADALLAALQAEVDWQQWQIKLFGRTLDQPRLSAWQADPGVSYRYSGVTRTPAPWTPTVEQIRARLHTSVGASGLAAPGWAGFNSCLLNRYRHGRDSMGLHADNEPELGPLIASVSLGAVRPMWFRHRKKKHPPASIALGHGSLLLMAGETQQRWLHEVRKTKRPLGERINLTFRVVRPRG